MKFVCAFPACMGFMPTWMMSPPLGGSSPVEDCGVWDCGRCNTNSSLGWFQCFEGPWSGAKINGWKGAKPRKFMGWHPVAHQALVSLTAPCLNPTAPKDGDGWLEQYIYISQVYVWGVRFSVGTGIISDYKRYTFPLTSEMWRLLNNLVVGSCRGHLR